MAKVYLNSNESFIVGASSTIYGSVGREQITILEDVYDVVIDSSIDVVHLPLDIEAYEFRQYGISLDIALKGNHIINIPSPNQRVIFNGKGYSVNYNAGVMTIKGVTLINNKYITLDTTPSKVDLRPYTDGVANQSYMNSCASFATITMIEIFLNKKNGTNDRFSQLFTYWGARTLDNYHNPIQDKGSTIGGNLWSVLKHGLCSLNTYPYIESKVNDTPPKSVLNSTRKVSMKYVYIKGTNQIRAEKIREGLGKGYAVVCSFDLTPDFYLLSDIHKLEDMNYRGKLDGASGTVHHAVCIVGYDDNLNGGSFIVENSWGNKWGDKGFFAVPYEVVNHDAQSVYSITRLEFE